ncbi:hypothetical protein [Brevibacterium aurantiacum]|uniref:Uncharacterized protein n=1 Tax=Brevibacterium aurantiacum TaxID=273384 RepID=A0A556C9F5_BREAU|nr:hypothetical protein [Brevibacterium aurantiacum]TSI14085.1 hypothetical protein FO013_15130 [Brevibacterium aurantiacum]
MSWDQLAQQTADAVHPEPEFDVLGHSHSLSVLREHKREAFVDGARWQRSKLRSDETVERVRECINNIVGIEVDEKTTRELVKALLKES